MGSRANPRPPLTEEHPQRNDRDRKQPLIASPSAAPSRLPFFASAASYPSTAVPPTAARSPAMISGGIAAMPWSFLACSAAAMIATASLPSTTNVQPADAIAECYNHRRTEVLYSRYSSVNFRSRYASSFLMTV